MRETTIPFSGFYESIHSGEIDCAIENMLSDSSGCNPVSNRISDEIWSHTGDVTAEYAREFLADFQTWLAGNCDVKVKLHFDELSSPRSYNFTTDRIFAKLSRDSVRKLYCAVDKALLDKVITARFTSYDGFSSFYAPNRAAWGKLDDWDANQVGTILVALVAQSKRENWEYEIIEDWSSEGLVDNWVYAALDSEGKRLVKLAGYLREREERKYR